MPQASVYWDGDEVWVYCWDYWWRCKFIEFWEEVESDVSDDGGSEVSDDDEWVFVD
jgi:hypothetical protein